MSYNVNSRLNTLLNAFSIVYTYNTSLVLYITSGMFGWQTADDVLVLNMITCASATFQPRHFPNDEICHLLWGQRPAYPHIPRLLMCIGPGFRQIPSLLESPGRRIVHGHAKRHSAKRRVGTGLLWFAELVSSVVRHLNCSVRIE